MSLPGLGKLDPNAVSSLLTDHLYDESAGVGFKEIEIEDGSFVAGVATKRIPIFIGVYDSVKSAVVERKEFVLREVFFRIDCANRMIEVHSSPRDVKSLIDVFSATGEHQILPHHVSVKAYEILLSMRADEKKYEIKKLDISDFTSESGVVGKYSIRSIDPTRAWKFVSQYSSQVKTAVVSQVDLGAELLFGVFDGGRFRIVARPRTSLPAAIIAIKTFLLKSNKGGK